MSVYVVRAFVKLREVLASHAELARKLETLEKSVASLDANTRRQFEEVYGAILSLMGPAASEQ
jgi:chaperonin cofactor prefoldin